MCESRVRDAEGARSAFRTARKRRQEWSDNVTRSSPTLAQVLERSERFALGARPISHAEIHNANLFYIFFRRRLDTISRFC